MRRATILLPVARMRPRLSNRPSEAGGAVLPIGTIYIRFCYVMGHVIPHLGRWPGDGPACE